MTPGFGAPTSAARASTFDETLRARLPVLVVNGRRADPLAPAASPFDRGLLLGDGVFDTMRLAAGAAFRADAHVERLARSAAVLGIHDEATAGRRVREALDVALERAAELGVREGSVRTTLTRGPGAPGLAPPRETWPLLLVAVHPAAHAAAAGAAPAPLAAVVTATGRRNPHSATAAHKVLSYTDSIIALHDARERGADDAIFLDTHGRVACGTASNVFVLADGALATPPAGGAVLPGVTRTVVLEVAATLGIPATERDVEADELTRADEIWLTSSVRGVAAVVRLDGRAVGTGVAGPVWPEVVAAYEAAVAAGCRA